MASVTANSNASNILLFIILVPLALVFGWVIASPLDYTGAAVFGLILATLLSPVLIRHHHPIAVFCWNAFLSAMFLPGDLPLWVLMAFVGVGFGILHRIVDRKVVWVNIPSLNWTLAILGAVVLLTAQATGGIGLRAAGGSSYGGKNYLLVLGAIMGYFALSSSRIPVEKAGRYTGLFFLPALTAVVGHIAFALGPAAYWLFYFFPSDLVRQEGYLLDFREYAPGSSSTDMFVEKKEQMEKGRLIFLLHFSGNKIKIPHVLYFPTRCPLCCSDW